MTVAELLQRWVAAAGLTHDEMAARIGCSQPFVTKVMNGTSRLSPKSVGDWARALRLNAEDADALAWAADLEQAPARVRAAVERYQAAAPRAPQQEDAPPPSLAAVIGELASTTRAVAKLSDDVQAMRAELARLCTALEAFNAGPSDRAGTALSPPAEPVPPAADPRVAEMLREEEAEAQRSQHHPPTSETA